MIQTPDVRKLSQPPQRLLLLLYARSVDFDEEDNDDDDDDEEDDEPPEIGNVETFRITQKQRQSSSSTRPSSSSSSSLSSILSYGYNKGRSSPSMRKAIGTSSSSMAHIYICTQCGSEYVQWRGKCPTCNEWNTIQSHTVSRSNNNNNNGSGSSSATGRPVFGSRSNGKNTFATERPIGSWLDDLPSYNNNNNNNGGGGGGWNSNHLPIRISDITTPPPTTTTTDSQPTSSRSGRIVIPDDDEFNTVLGGGIMKGSLLLLGGDPGVGKSTLALQIAGTIATQLSTQPSTLVNNNNSKIGMGNGTSTTTTKQEQAPHHDRIGPVWYVSGEENPDQIASRAARLGITSGDDGNPQYNKKSRLKQQQQRPSELFLLRQTHVDTLCEQVVSHHMPQQQAPPQYRRRSPRSSDYDDDDDDDDYTVAHVPPNLPISLLIIDSIQTMICDAGGTSHAGGITQVRECVAMFLRLAKSINVPILLIGHVTKSGEVAGPRTVEHMVDCVLYLDGMNEGNGGMTNLRMLRASKNRFGSSDEVGVYEMTQGRLLPVSDPSSLFLAHRNDQDDAEGCAIAIALEGMRAMTVEVQALVTMAAGEGNYGGRRTVNGIAHSRLLLLLGVLQKRCHMFWSKQDIYINVVGRIRLDRGEGNAADLAIAVALASSRHCIPIRADTAFVGEIGLLGELRTVPALEKRLQEARRMGFSRVITPRDYRTNRSRKKNAQQSTTVTHVNGIEWIQCTLLSNAINEGLVHPIPKKTSRQRVKSSSGNGSTDVETNTNDFLLEILDSDDDDEDGFL